MNNSQEANQPNNNPNPSDSVPQKNSLPPPDFFCFLKAKENFSRPRPFFSENGLSHDIIKVTNAEPDICLEVFYALYNTLWPQIAKQSTTSLKNAWQHLIGNSIFKGVLCPPEILMGKKRLTDFKSILSTNEGEKQIFESLDQVINFISQLKQEILNYPGEILQKEDIIASLDLVEEFYQGYRARVKKLGRSLIEASSVSENDELLKALEDLLEPKAVIMSDIFPNHWAYRISRNKAQKLLSIDDHGRAVRNNSDEPANHRVAALPETSEPLVYFKANGNPMLQPEKEFMLYSLYRHLQIPVPETALLILTNVFDGKSELFYSVQASEAVIGESALKACQNQETIFEEKAYVEQVIGTLLTNPSDGKLANFKYSPIYKALIGIDNDLVFGPEFIGEDGKIVNTKSALYLLPQMDKLIPASVKAYFTTLDPPLMIFLWLHDLQRKNQEYKLLFTRLSYQNARSTFQCLLPGSALPSLDDEIQQQVSVDSEVHGDDFYPHISVSKNLLNNLTRKLEKIKSVLLDNRSATTLQMLFEEITPILGKYYERLRKEFENLKTSLEALWGHMRNKVDYSCVSSLLKDEELENLTENEIIFHCDIEYCEPEKHFGEYKKELISQEFPLDRLIRRHRERKMKEILNLQELLKELQFLQQEELTDSKSFREVVDFCFNLCKSTQEQEIVQEIVSILFSLPQVELQWLLTLERYFLRTEDYSSFYESPPLAVHGAFLKQRIFNLTEPEKEFLFDSQGNIKKNTSLTGRSRVTCFPDINPEFYLKQYPEWPGYEFASNLFMRLLGVTHLPYQELILNKTPEYPILLTQKVDGNPVFRVWQDPEAFNHLDPFQTGLLIVAAILLNPEDGKEDNYILSPDGKYLIPIDHDHCFLPSTFQKGKFWNFFVNTALQTKTLLFCLDEMNKPIPLEVKHHILSIDFDSLLTSWMRELVKVEDRYNHLVDQQQRNAFLENGTVLRIPFYEQFVHNLFWKVHKIQDLLQSTTEQTPFSLLKAVEPFAARCYSQSFQNERTLQNRFKAATKELYVDLKKETEGSRASILNTRTMMDIINVSEKDLQNDATYNKMGPLDALELLKDLIQQRDQNAKLEQDLLCELDDKNEEGIWTTLFGDPVLEAAFKTFFANPKEGLVLKGSKLVTESNLKDLFAQTPEQGTKIKFLSLPNSPQLDRRALEVLVEGCPNLEYLNVSGCAKIEEIVTQKGEWSLLTRLEAKKCLNLKKFVSQSPIKILRIGTYQKIEVFVEKHILDIFTISTQTNRFDFMLTKGDNFEAMPLEKTAFIDHLLQSALLENEIFDWYFRNPKITIGEYSILSPKDLGVFITSLDMRTEEISSDQFKEIVQIKHLNLKSLQLPLFKTQGIEIFEDLIQGDWPQLIYLNLFNNEITDEGLVILSKKNWPLLETFYLDNAKTTKKGMLNFLISPNWFHLREIKYFRVQGDNLSLFFQKNEHLVERLDLSSGQITPVEIETIVNLPKWTNLSFLNLSNNEIYDEGLEILSQGNWPLLETLYLLNVGITTVGIEVIVKRSNWLNLKELNMSENEVNDQALVILSQGNWHFLERVNVNKTRVTNKGLLFFYLNAKKRKTQTITLSPVDFDLVTFIDRNNFSQVERLELNNVEITSVEIEEMIEISQFQRLKSLNLSHNQIFEKGTSLLTRANWPLLEELNLQNTNITLKGIEMIVNQSRWKQFKHLNLSENKFSDEGLSLLSLANWPTLEELNVENTNITSKGIEKIANQSMWRQLKNLNISNNEIFDEGILLFAQTEWPFLEELHLQNTKITPQSIETLVNKMSLVNLKKLDISENILGDQELKTLASAKWPWFQHLVYYDIQVTIKGHITLFENMEWPNFQHLEHSFAESFYNYDQNANTCYPPKIILATVPLYYRAESILVTVLDAIWLNSKEIHLSIRHNGCNEKIILLSRDKLDQLEYIQFSPFPCFIIGFIVWPSTLKKLDISTSLSDEKILKSLFFTKCPLLEDLNLRNTGITAIGIESLISQSKWPHLKSLDISENPIQDKGLEILFTEKWPLLENLGLRNTGLTIEGIKSLVDTSDYSNLKSLDLSNNPIYDEGLKTLSYGKWPLLENLGLRNTGLTIEGVKSMVDTSDWSNLKTLDISDNSIDDEGLKALSGGKWPLLESLNLQKTQIAPEMVDTSKWPNLRILDLSQNKIINQRSSGNWHFLESLNLRNISLEEEAIASLARTSELSQLKTLDISDNYLCDKGLEILSSIKWSLLENLNLSNTSLTADGMKIMRDISNWPNLKALDISHNRISDPGMEILSSIKWSFLENLNLRNIHITADGVESLISISKWPNLKILDVSSNCVSSLGLKVLSSGKWPLLESLKLIETMITFEGIKKMIKISEWPNLKEIHLLESQSPFEGIEKKKLISAKWPRVQLILYKYPKKSS